MASRLSTYITKASTLVGSDFELGQRLKLTDGSRIGMWKRGEGRPAELTCVRLARLTGDDPLTILRLAGHQEMADLLAGTIVTSSAAKARAHVKAALRELDRALERRTTNRKRG